MDSAGTNNFNIDDYGIGSNDGVLRLVPYEFNSDSEDSYELLSTSKGRKKRTWFESRNKERTEKGKSYLGKQKSGNSWTYEKRKEPRTLKERRGCTKNITIKCANK